MTHLVSTFRNTNEAGSDSGVSIIDTDDGKEVARISVARQTDGRAIVSVGLVGEDGVLAEAFSFDPAGKKLWAPEATMYVKADAFSGCAFADLPDPNENWGVRTVIMDSLVPLNSETIGEVAQGGGVYWVPVHSRNKSADPNDGAEWALG